MYVENVATPKQHIYTETNRNIQKRSKMWNMIKDQLQEYPERLKVARVLIENGLSVQGNKVCLNQIEIPPVRIARAAGVDRRTVNETLRTIEADPELKLIFEEIRPAGHSLKEIAKHLNLGVLEITPVNAMSPGILSNAAMILNRAGLSIRQAIVDDPELSPEPKLTLIVEKKIPGELISELLKTPGIAKVSVY
ncbi:MAG: amino acid-binding protein [Candidatus Bathyarchaeia archaeon]